MNDYEHRLYDSPLNLPEQRVGRMSIKHRVIPTGEREPIVGLRQAINRGINPVSAKLAKPRLIHELYERGTHGRAGGLWMTDRPEELNQIGEMLHTLQPQGRVLVGGLGLGICAAMVAKLEGVTKVIAVDRSKDVIALTAQKDLYDVRCADIGAYLRKAKRPFDYYLLDTWAGTSESTWWDEVLPLRRIIRGQFGIGPEVHCWAEDIMWGQIGASLMRQGSMGHPPVWYYSYLPCPMTHAEADAFLNMAGTPWWEKKYGAAVDRYVAEQDAQRKARSA